MMLLADDKARYADDAFMRTERVESIILKMHLVYGITDMII